MSDGQGLGVMMTYGNGEGNTVTHHYAGAMNGKKKPKKRKCKKSLSKK